MMAINIKTIHRNGVTFLGRHWYNENFYGYRGKVIIRYSFADLSQIYVFTDKNEFLCTAKPTEKINPMISERGDITDLESLKQQIQARRRMLASTKKTGNLILALGGETTRDREWNLTIPRVPETAGMLKAIEKKHKPTKLISLSSAEEIAQFEIPPEVTGPAQFGSFSEKFEYLAQKPNLNEAEEKWIQQFISGEIAPGEYKSSYGGGYAT
jgi:putative transposase